jgi:hypothetical protein
VDNQGVNDDDGGVDGRSVEVDDRVAVVVAMTCY